MRGPLRDGVASLLVVLSLFAPVPAVAVDVPAAAPEEPAADGDAVHVIRYENDALTVRLHQVPVTDVLDELGRQSGAVIRGQVREPREVTVEFDAVPLSDALHRLLGSQNFALVYADGGRLRAVKLLGGPAAATGAKAPTPATVAAPAAPAAAPVSPAALMAMFERHPPVPVTGRLADAIGGESATFMQLATAGVQNDDPVVRLEAVRAALQAVEAEPELRTALLSAVNGLADGDVSNLVRGAAGDKAEEIAMHIASQARTTELRAKASTLLRELRKTRSGG
jgi:hypothetical protein